VNQVVVLVATRRDKTKRENRETSADDGAEDGPLLHLGLGRIEVSRPISHGVVRIVLPVERTSKLCVGVGRTLRIGVVGTVCTGGGVVGSRNLR
jgi:hypothetical protein